MPAGVTRRETRALLALGLPLIAAQLGQMMLGVVDTVMVGRVSVDALDAAALGNTWSWGVSMFAMGVTFGLDALVPRAHGEGDEAALHRLLRVGITTATLVALPTLALWWFTGSALLLAGQDPHHAALAERYVHAQAWSLLPLLWFSALRQYLAGRHIVAPAVWTLVFANLFNICANELLIFGRLGLPALGLEGAAIATGSTRLFALVALVIISVRTTPALLPTPTQPWRWWSPRGTAPGVRALLRVGAPVGLQYTLEMSAFQISTLMAGRLGAIPLAAHTIVLNIASVSFMVPLGISLGASVRVGTLLGEHKPLAARRAMWAAFGLGATFMGVAGVVMLGLRELLPSLYTADVGVIALATTLLPISATFQVFDGLQCVGGGVLRGWGDTRPAAAFNLIGYYALALPIAYHLAFARGWGVTGIWWGLCVGLMFVSLALVLWTKLRLRPAGLADATARATANDAQATP